MSSVSDTLALCSLSSSALWSVPPSLMEKIDYALFLLSPTLGRRVASTTQFQHTMLTEGLRTREMHSSEVVFIHRFLFPFARLDLGLRKNFTLLTGSAGMLGCCNNRLAHVAHTHMSLVLHLHRFAIPIPSHLHLFEFLASDLYAVYLCPSLFRFPFLLLSSCFLIRPLFPFVIAFLSVLFILFVHS